MKPPPPDVDAATGALPLPPPLVAVTVFLLSVRAPAVDDVVEEDGDVLLAGVDGLAAWLDAFAAPAVSLALAAGWDCAFCGSILAAIALLAGRDDVCSDPLETAGDEPEGLASAPAGLPADP
ncbi:MAG: hypothetical protein ACR2QJ_05670, partial [Geminicoccaceae bacterium]